MKSDEGNESKSDFWCANSGASSHMTSGREWFSELKEYTGKKMVKLADRYSLETHDIGTILLDARVNNQ